jgi:hypothetical protein
MTNDVKKPVVIDKEEVLNLRFPDVEVLSNADEIARRKMELERATTLGNTEQSKYKIIFEDDKGVKMVETTIWAMTDKRIVLKKGAVIPINRVHDVKFA